MRLWICGGLLVPVTLAWLSFVLLPQPVGAQAPAVHELLDRVGQYIGTFIANFSNVVAEESYKQEIASRHRKRQLKSDYMLVRYPGATAG